MGKIHSKQGTARVSRVVDAQMLAPGLFAKASVPVHARNLNFSSVNFASWPVAAASANLEDNCKLSVELPSSGKHCLGLASHLGKDINEINNGTVPVKLEDTSCALTAKRTNPQQWSVTVHNADAKRNLAAEDITCLARALYESIVASAGPPSKDGKAVNLHLTLHRGSCHETIVASSPLQKLNNQLKADMASGTVVPQPSCNHCDQSVPPLPSTSFQGANLAAADKRHLAMLVQKNMERNRAAHSQKVKSRQQRPTSFQQATAPQLPENKGCFSYMSAAMARCNYLDIAGADNYSTAATRNGERAACRGACCQPPSNVGTVECSRLECACCQDQDCEHQLRGSGVAADGVDRLAFPADNALGCHPKLRSRPCAHSSEGARQQLSHGLHCTATARTGHWSSHRHRRRHRDRAMALVAEWIEREHLDGKPSPAAVHPDSAVVASAGACPDSVVTQDHRHIHEHHHHYHYHHYYET